MPLHAVTAANTSQPGDRVHHYVSRGGAFPIDKCDEYIESIVLFRWLAKLLLRPLFWCVSAGGEASIVWSGLSSQPERQHNGRKRDGGKNDRRWDQSSQVHMCFSYHACSHALLHYHSTTAATLLICSALDANHTMRNQCVEFFIKISNCTAILKGLFQEITNSKYKQFLAVMS